MATFLSDQGIPSPLNLAQLSAADIPPMMESAPDTLVLRQVWEAVRTTESNAAVPDHLAQLIH